MHYFETNAETGNICWIVKDSTVTQKSCFAMLWSTTVYHMVKKLMKRSVVVPSLFLRSEFSSISVHGSTNHDSLPLLELIWSVAWPLELNFVVGYIVNEEAAVPPRKHFGGEKTKPKYINTTMPVHICATSLIEFLSIGDRRVDVWKDIECQGIVESCFLVQISWKKLPL